MRTATAIGAALVVAVVSGCGNSTTTNITVESPAKVHAATTTYRVPSGSMEPTLKIGSDITVVEGTLKVGDIVVFHPPEGAESEQCGNTAAPGEACSQPVEKESEVKFVERIVAGPGDQIYIEDGHVYRKAAGTSTFVRESDPYIRECGANPQCTYSKPITIPAGDWFMMGDNRGESDDSRFWGPRAHGMDPGHRARALSAPLRPETDVYPDRRRRSSPRSTGVIASPAATARSV